VVVPPAPPRTLPPQDHEALDRAAREAQRFTRAVGGGMLAMALLVAMLLLTRLT
jgi:hypothetical protein